MQKRVIRRVVPGFMAVAAMTVGFVGLGANGSGATSPNQFEMVRSTAAVNTGCLPNAKASVRVVQFEQNEHMFVRVSGLPPETAFDLFVIQTPDAPFGVAWYQSDLETNHGGHGEVMVAGRFNKETFSLSLGGPANGSDPTQGLTGPAVKDTNVVFRPTSQFHLGLWFNSPEDAAKAGCGSNVTPFNGEQHAGVQAMSTRNFPVDAGPLGNID